MSKKIHTGRRIYKLINASTRISISQYVYLCSGAMLPLKMGRGGEAR